jgi:PAS domain S-box-containing protein
VGLSSEAEAMDTCTQRDEGAGVSEQSARSSLEAFRAIAENTPDLIFRFDREHRHVYVNPAVERRMRRPRRTIRGKTLEELGIVADVAELWDEQLERVFRSGRERGFEFALGSSWVDAQEHFEARAVPETDRQGTVVTVLVVVREVTERRNAEKALAEREAALANAQRIAGCGSFQWELATGELRCSEELRRRLPFPPREGDQASLDDLIALVHPDDRERVRRRLEDAARSEGAWSMQFRAIDRDGVARVLHSRGEVVSDDRGQPIRLHGTTLDVTEPDDVQRTVRQLLRFSQFAVEHMNDATLWIDPTGRIVSVNGAACERFDQPADALVGTHIAMLGLMESTEDWSQRWQALADAGRLRYEIARASDEPVEITAHHAMLQGQEYGCLFVRDARAKQPATCTPLQTILMWTELLGRNDDPDTRARGLAMITESARAQQRLLDTLFGASGAPKPQLDPAAAHLLGEGELEIRGVGPLRALRIDAHGVRAP